MVTLPDRRKMEMGRRKTYVGGEVSRKSLNCRISSFESLNSAFLLLILFSWTSVSGEEAAMTFTSNFSVMTTEDIQSRASMTCTEPKYIEQSVTVSCEGYNTIPTGLSDVVKVLNMSKGNALQTLKDGALIRANLPLLRKLYLTNCQIRTIEKGAFGGGQRIEYLDLSYNRIEVLDPEVFAGMNTLKFLHLKGNSIHRFQPGSVFPALSLITLDLSDCKLDNIPEGVFDNLKNIEKIQLSNNELETLSWKVFRGVTHLLHTIDLQWNPWHCDCNVRFFLELLRERQISIYQNTVCSTSPEYETGKDLRNTSWAYLTDNTLICPAKILDLDLKSHDVLPPSGLPGELQRTSFDQGSTETAEKVELGQDVYFECEYSGYPEPEVAWLKDDRPIHPDVLPRSGGHQPGEHGEIHSIKRQAKIEIQNGNSHIEMMDDVEKQRNYKFKEHLIVRRVQAEDRGMYVCLVKGSNGLTAEKGKLLNMTVLAGDGLFLGGVGGKKGVALWLWILLAILCILILVLLTLLICLIWRKKEKKKQETFRKVIHEKFKDSNVDLGELLDTKPQQTNQLNQTAETTLPDGSTPLLESQNTTILIADHFPPQKASASHLPDVALGNGQLVRNSGIFSPKPPLTYNGHITPADARKEFFARQISEPYLRPASAMSIVGPNNLNANQKRYIFANTHQNQSAPIPGEPFYAIPEQIRNLPRSGSALSMSALPEHDLRRQMFLRQNYPQPIYATATRAPPYRRNPSVSSEPAQELASFTYSTLPRRTNRYPSWSRPVSPTNSTCSNYSTLSWRPNINPVTGVVSDGVGPRTGADGGSTLSLCKTPESLSGSTSNLSYGGGGGGLESMNRAMKTPVQMNGGGKVKSVPRSQRLAHSRTPSSLTRGNNDFFSFEPIQEVEGSETASSFTLDRIGAGGRQTPQGLYTQSLARGDPRYKKKKPPPLAVIPTNLKEPSGAFDHLKGRSVSPALRNSAKSTGNSVIDSNMNPTEEEKSTSPRTDTDPIIVEDLSIRKDKPLKDRVNGVGGNDKIAPVLDSPIDEVIQLQPTEEIPSSKVLPKSGKLPPPLPPPKPKRSQEALDKDIQDVIDHGEEKVNHEHIGDNGGTVV